MTRTPEQNLDGVMRYLKHIEPKREQFERVTRQDLADLLARLDQTDARLEELSARLDELL